MDRSSLRVACFQGTAMQAIHKYADFVLLLLVAMLAWWLVGLDDRITKGKDQAQALAQEISRAGARNEELFRRLDGIDQKLIVIDNRLYTILGGRGQHAP